MSPAGSRTKGAEEKQAFSYVSRGISDFIKRFQALREMLQVQIVWHINVIKAEKEQQPQFVGTFWAPQLNAAFLKQSLQRPTPRPPRHSTPAPALLRDSDYHWWTKSQRLNMFIHDETPGPALDKCLLKTSVFGFYAWRGAGIKKGVHPGSIPAFMSSDHNFTIIRPANKCLKMVMC